MFLCTRGAFLPRQMRPRCVTSASLLLRAKNTARRWESSERQIVLNRLSHDDYENAFVSTITLNRPKANAMGTVMLQELSDTLDTLEEDPSTRCVVVTSCSPKVFSAGADLKERANMTMEEASDFVTRLRNTFERLSQLPVPTLAALEGVAVGGGLELALATDLRISGMGALFGLPETSLAIIPGAGATQRLPRLIGVARAKELIFTGRRIDATTALEYGLVQHVVEQGQAKSKAIELAWEIAKNGPIAIRAAKEAIDIGIKSPDIQNALQIERQCYQRVIPTQDRLEGLAAFREGRSPVYKGN